MPDTRALVGNAADPQQVKNAGRIQKRAAERYLVALANVMNMYEGRFAMWMLLKKCGVFESVMHASGSMTFYNAGRQDIGHELQRDLLSLKDGELYLLMQGEAIARLKEHNIRAEANQQQQPDEDKP